MDALRGASETSYRSDDDALRVQLVVADSGQAAVAVLPVLAAAPASRSASKLPAIV